MKAFFATMALVAGCSSPLWAGGPSRVAPDPVVMPPMVMTPVRADWTGGYVGGLLGYGRIERSAPLRSSGSGGLGALVAGYDRDYGTWVLGAEVMAAPGAGFEVGGREINHFLGARLKAGYKMSADGRWLGTGSLGAARVTHEAIGGGDRRSSTGTVFGLGVSYLHSRNISLSGEIVTVRDGSDGPRGNLLLLGAQYRF